MINLLKLTAGLLVSFVIVGCVETMPTKPNVVEVPIKVKCKPTTIIKDLPKSKLDTSAKTLPLAEKTKLAIAELEMAKARNIELETALAECTK